MSTPDPVAPIAAVASVAPAGYRRAATTPRQVRELAFDRLPPVVRERLTHGIVHGAPEPLLAAPSGRTLVALRAAITLAVASAVGVVVLALRGFGDVQSAQSLQPASLVAVYAGLLAAAVLGAATAALLRRFQRGAPFRSGRYLFSLDLVEATGGRLRVTSLDTLRALEPRAARNGAEIAAVFEDGHAVTFPVARHDDPAALIKKVNADLAFARSLAYPADEVKLERLDPFFEVRVTEDWAAVADPGGPSRGRLLLLAGAAVLAAAPAGFGLWHGRNVLSDDMMFEEARTRRPGDDVTRKLLAYARRGTRHLPEAARVLVDEAGDDRSTLRRYAASGGPLAPAAQDALFELTKHDAGELDTYLRRGGPRADEADEALYAIARRMDSVPGYSTYLEHGKLHAAEVRDTLLPEADYAQALRTGLVGALISFVRRHPGSKHEDEAWALVRKHYAEALPAFQQAMHPPADGLKFAEALLAALQERADPRVVLDIHMDPPSAVADADLTLGAKYGAVYLPATGHFSEGSLTQLSEDVRSGVAGWFGRAFPHGVAEISRASSATPEAEPGPRFEIVCHPVADGASLWRSAGSTSGPITHVTPLIGFVVTVRGILPGRDGDKDQTFSWELRLADTTDTKMLVKDFKGDQRGRRDMLDDAFSMFIESVAPRITQSFTDKL